MFTLGIYKTREAAEEAAALWSDVYADEDLIIEPDGYGHFLLKVRDDENPV